jgi:hypothetical protein
LCAIAESRREGSAKPAARSQPAVAPVPEDFLPLPLPDAHQPDDTDVIEDVAGELHARRAQWEYDARDMCFFGRLLGGTWTRVKNKQWSEKSIGGPTRRNNGNRLVDR